MKAILLSDNPEVCPGLVDTVDDLCEEEILAPTVPKSYLDACQAILGLHSDPAAKMKRKHKLLSKRLLSDKKKPEKKDRLEKKERRHSSKSKRLSRPQIEEAPDNGPKVLPTMTLNAVTNLALNAKVTNRLSTRSCRGIWINSSTSSIGEDLTICSGLDR